MERFPSTLKFKCQTSLHPGSFIVSISHISGKFKNKTVNFKNIQIHFCTYLCFSNIYIINLCLLKIYLRRVGGDCEVKNSAKLQSEWVLSELLARGRPSPTNMQKTVLIDPRPTSDSKNVNNKRLPRPGVAVPFQHKPPRFHNMLRKLYKDSKVNLTGEIEECSQSVRQFYFIIIFNYLCVFFSQS